MTAPTTTPADLVHLASVHASGAYDLEDGTGEAVTRVPSSSEWVTSQQVEALLVDDDDTDDDDAEIACRIIEQGAGLAAVRRGCYVAGDGRLYRVERASGTIHTDDSRGNYLLAEVVEVEWDEQDVVQAKVAIGDDDDDIDDDDDDDDDIDDRDD